jgi:serine/threonine-protein kinase
MTTPPKTSAVEWARAFDIFEQAIAIDDPTQRARVVSAECNGDAELRDAVRRLLDADGVSSALLDTPAAAHAADLVEDDDVAAAAQASAVGRVVGPYRIVREIGRGGMGVVYLAERADVPMRVALKIVRGGLAAPEHIERFLFERRVLARLEHPRIARLVDAGVSDDGTPWFAMEYFEGEPIDQFCDTRCLTIADRVALFERVCEVVQFAHGNLVVHRDLKPSNVLVANAPTGAPGLAEPKLLDFGIAKLLDDGAESLTGTATRLMTPDYAAPEQVRGTPVTTVTDVYSLGVVLYELLTGRPPYELRSASLADVARAVLDTQPPKPSTVAFTPEVAAARGTTLERLRRQLVGDLDTIVGKALEKEPAMRYPSAEALLRDLRRHREGRAVSARPATMGYRVRTFVRRHRVLVGSTVAVLVMLAGFAASMTYQQAQTARALRRAEAETAKARDVTRFLVGMFREADPFQQATAVDGSPGAEAALDASARRIESELAAQPDVRGELLATLGVIQRNLGRYPQSEALLRKAIEERRRTLGSADVVDLDLARLYHELGVTVRFQTSYDSSLVWLTRALAMRRAMLPADDPDIAASLGELASALRYLGRSAESRHMFEEVARLQQAHGDSVDLAVTLDRLAVFTLEDGDGVRAEALVRRSLAIRQRLLGPDHPQVAHAFSRLAWVLHGPDPAGAEQAARQALEIQQRRLGSGHPATLTTLAELSLLARDKGDLEEAERLQREVLDGRRKVLGEPHRDVGGALANLAATLESRGDLVGADTLRSQALAMYRKLGGSDPDYWALTLQLAAFKLKVDDQTGAMQLAREVATFHDYVVRGWDESAVDELVTLAGLLASHADCNTARTLAERADAIRARVDTTRTRPSTVSALTACRAK